MAAGSEHCVVAVEALKQCLAHLNDRGIASEFGEVLWHQGESDALAIDEDHFSLTDYRESFREMLLWFRKTFEESVDLFQFTIGQPRSGDTDEFRAIGSAQDDFAEEDEHVYVVYDGATSFATEGRMRDELHYTQVGYDEMGREGTRRVAGIVRD